MVLVAHAAQLILGELSAEQLGQLKQDATAKQQQQHRQQVISRVVMKAFSEVDQNGTNKLKGKEVLMWQHKEMLQHDAAAFTTQQHTICHVCNESSVCP